MRRAGTDQDGRWTLILLLVGAVSCRPEPSAPPHEANGPRPLSALDSLTTGICDSVSGRWRLMQGVEVRLLDTIQMAHADSAIRQGCLVRATSSTVIEDTAGQRLYWSMAESKGWIPLWQFSADGPDGSALTWERGTVRCWVRDGWDGGDDSDSTYVPAPWFEQETFCWRYEGSPTVPVMEPPPSPVGALTGARGIRLLRDSARPH